MRTATKWAVIDSQWTVYCNRIHFYIMYDIKTDGSFSPEWV